MARQDLCQSIEAATVHTAPSFVILGSRGDERLTDQIREYREPGGHRRLWPGAIPLETAVGAERQNGAESPASVGIEAAIIIDSAVPLSSTRWCVTLRTR